MSEVIAKSLVEKVFVTEGTPQTTFVKPPNFNDILLDVRHPGKPVIVEGQSGTGKTTCVRKVIEQLAEGVAPEYLTARNPADSRRISEIATSTCRGRFVIDDFHRLDHVIQEGLADRAKFAAEAGEAAEVKLILIGINEVGSELIQLVPDIAKRVGIHRIKPGTKSDIRVLIDIGCLQLNVDIVNRDSIFEESRGDYWLTQQLCQAICLMNNVLETADVKKSFDFEINKLRGKLVDKLSASFYPAVKDFCRGVRFRPNNDPYLKLLQKIGQQNSSIVDLNELANANADVRGSINNIKEVRLSSLLRDKSTCGRYFYYNSETKNFAIEDPALFYFIKHLNWTALRQDCGFRYQAKDYDYDFALSFAGENRGLARQIASQLVVLDCHVFFDENFEVNFLGGAWSKQFEEIFGKGARLVVCILDKNYREKIWPTFERECFLPRIPDGEVIPIFLDKTIFPGISQDVIGIKFDVDQGVDVNPDRVTDEISFKLVERLGNL